jgi:PAS domain S-box-containing protein
MESRMHAIASIGSLIVSSLDRRELLNQVVRWVERELDVPAVSILLMDERRRHLVFEVASGEKGEDVKAFTLELGQGVAGTVAATGEPLIVNDADRDPRQARDIAEAVQYPTRSILCVPMKLHGEVIGVIEALNKRSGRFTEYDESLLSVIAGQAALFLESARLYGEMQRRVEEATADLRVANRDLATQKAKIETLVDEMESGVIATDARDRVVMWNRAAERLLGVSERVALGQPALAVIHHPGLSELFAMPLSPLGGRHATELDLTVDDQNLVIRASITLVDEADGQQGKLAVLTDITQLKEIDRMKTDLISFVSHELKNPLASIKGFAQLLLRSTSPDSPQSKLVALLNQQTNRMQWLVEDILDVARIDAGVALEMRWSQITDLRALVEGLVNLQAVTDEGHQFVVDIPDTLPPFTADRGKLEQVLVNLISNACKYSPEGGEVRIAAQVQDGLLTLTVSDEGIGLSPEDEANLFQRFRRGAGAGRKRIAGTGIGLFLSRHLVEAHGGRIWAQRREKGTTFYVQIPLQPAQQPESEA